MAVVTAVSLGVFRVKWGSAEPGGLMPLVPKPSLVRGYESKMVPNGERKLNRTPCDVISDHNDQL